MNSAGHWFERQMFCYYFLFIVIFFSYNCHAIASSGQQIERILSKSTDSQMKKWCANFPDECYKILRTQSKRTIDQREYRPHLVFSEPSRRKRFLILRKVILAKRI
uniref:Uncharacterized protein n=1 Tax=Clytia hemisphaerica TaxID=252671 RepID=A0A7M5VCQ2_9CNID